MGSWRHWREARCKITVFSSWVRPGPADSCRRVCRPVSQLLDRIKATPRQPGVEAISIPSEWAFRERDRRRVEGPVLERKVVEALTALASA